jgi:hypothetical protein
MGRTSRSSPPIQSMTSRMESHLLVVLALRDDPETDELVAVETWTVVEVKTDAVLLTTVVLAVGAAVELEAARLGLGLPMGLEVKADVVGTPFAVAQYRE